MVPPLATRMPLRLELSIKGDVVSGSFQGQWRKNFKNLDRVEVAGKATGLVVDPRENSSNPAAVWPTYMGPHQNFSSGRFSQPIVEDLNQARLVWVSEFIGPRKPAHIATVPAWESLLPPVGFLRSWLTDACTRSAIRRPETSLRNRTSRRS